MIGQLGGVGGMALAEAARMKQQEVATKRGILAAELEKEKMLQKRKKKQKYNVQEKTAPVEANMSSSMFLMCDFGVPLAQRWLIEAKEGIKTIGGVGKDLITKQAWDNPRKKKQWMENLGQGYAEARNRVQQSLRKANDANIEKELTKNKKAMQEDVIRKMRSQATEKYKAGRLSDLAPTPRMEPEGLLAIDKRYKIGKDDRTKMPVISEITTIQKGRLKSANS